MRKRRGFTLLEVLLALSILSVMGLMIFGSFRSLVDSTLTAEKALDELHLTAHVARQITESLRSAVFFGSDPRRYTFRFEQGTGSPRADKLSWVTHSGAFLPPDYPTPEGLNRIELTVQDLDGERGLTARAFSSLYDPESEEAEEVEPWMISTAIKGLELHFYDMGEQDWTDDWERDNQLPTFLILTLYFQQEAPGAEMQTLHLPLEIPVGKMSRQTRRGQRQVQDR
ncbi:MAG: PulJ/GspJ family protein [Kiritimatiellia bacterium]